MRKLTLLSLGLLLCGAAHAQFKEGDIQLGVGLNISEQGIVSNQINVKRIQTGASLFLSDRLSAGLLLGYRNTLRTKFNNSDDELSDQVFQFGIYARYHQAIADKVHVYLQPSVLWGSGNSDISPVNNVDYRTVYLQLSPGITYLFTERWGLDLSFSGLRYTQVKQDAGQIDDRLSDSDFTMNLNNISVGLSFYLN